MKREVSSLRNIGTKYCQYRKLETLFHENGTAYRSLEKTFHKMRHEYVRDVHLTVAYAGYFNSGLLSNPSHNVHVTMVAA